MISWRISRNLRNAVAKRHICTETEGKREGNNRCDQRFYESFTNSITKRRRPTALREISHVVSKMPANTISFSVGAPNSETFPFESLGFTLKDGTSIQLRGPDLAIALQYLPSKGYAPLINQLKRFQDDLHGPQDWTKTGLLVTAGGQEALCNTIEMTMEEGASIILQSPVYPAVIDLLRPYKPNYIPVEQDREGMVPELLLSALENCVKRNLPLPKAIYFNPIGCNPTGACLSTARKKIIYEIASQYNLMILEDDSYFFIHYLKEDPESFLSMDVDGRVIRFDTFSKVLSSGLRLGLVTGPEPLLRKIELHIQVSTVHTSALSQVILYKLFEQWGTDGMLKHFKSVREFYRMKRDQMLSAVTKHLTGLAEWCVPDGGLFLWLKLNGIEDTYEMAMNRCIKNSLVIIPGHPFTSFGPGRPCPYIRLSYSMVTPSQMDQGCAKLATIIREEQAKDRCNQKMPAVSRQ